MSSVRIPVGLTMFAAMAAALLWSAPAAAQVAPCPEPVRLPPRESPPLLRCMQLVAHPVNETVVEGQTYDYYIKTPRTNSATDTWAPYDEDAIRADFWNLWRTGFLDNLWIEVLDEPYANGVVGKHVIFHIEERSRVKAVDYVPAEGTRTDVDVSKIEEALRSKDIRVSLDVFVDEATIRRVKGVIRELYAGKGHNDVTVESDLKALPGGPKLVHLTFTIDQGPKYRLREVLFDGNSAFSDGTLRSQMVDNKPKSWWSFLTSGGTYLDTKIAEDAEAVNDFYRNKGYVRAIVGQPRVEVIADSPDGRTRWIRLRIPVDEGRRYRVGSLTVEGNTALRTEFLRAQFKLKDGDYYNYERITKGFEKVQEAYGSVGFIQWNPDVELLPRGVDPQTGLPTGSGEAPAVVDVKIKMIEGPQYRVNRITFLGNTTTHDSVARREMRILEGDVFNGQALKESVRRLNQLGYFQPLEGSPEELQVDPLEGREGLVDVTLKFQEQNRNMITFGAGVSQFDGFFGQLSYQTSNFLGRGETFAISLQSGSRARQYQFSFSEPYLFDRPITVGWDVYSRRFEFPFQYTQDAAGTNFVVGLPVANYTRLFTTYSYERTRVFDIAEAYLDPFVLASSPFLAQSLLLDQNGRRTVSKISPTLVYNTVNMPIFPSAGTRYTAQVEFAGLGGNTSFVQVRGEAIWYLPLTRRTSIGVRTEAQWITPYGQTTTLPIFEKFFLGGEYTIRGFDMRTVGPRDRISRVVTGGNKTLLLNAEYYFNIGGPVRLVAFYDAGQVRDEGQKFAWKDDILERFDPDLPLLYDPLTGRILGPPGFTPSTATRVIGQTPAFKTSTGFEVRFFVPVLNVPFRLIAAYNPSRRGILNQNLLFTEKFVFRFAVGTTF